MAMSRRLLWLLAPLLPLALGAEEQDEGPLVEVEFEPLGAGGPGPEALLSMLAGIDSSHGGGLARGSSGAAAVQSRSVADADDLGSLFSSLLASRGLQQQRARQRRGGSAEGRGGAMDLLGAGPEVWLEPISLEEPSTVPAAVFRDLFPSPVALAQPDAASDFLVADMMRHLSGMFKETMMPALLSGPAAARLQQERGAQPTCQEEVRSLCNNTGRQAKSQLHCLGQHADNITDGCRRRVGKSVPFLCHKAIDKWCDGLDRGILPCLADRLGELQDGACRDAVVATHRVIAQVNTQRASVRDPATGALLVHVPTAAAAREATTLPRAADLDDSEFDDSDDDSLAAAPAPPPSAAQREAKLDKLFVATTLPAPASSAQATTLAAAATTARTAAAGPEPPHATAVRVERGVLKASFPAAVAPAAPAAPQKQAFVEPGGGGRSWGGYFQAAAMLLCVVACIYLLKGQVPSKSRCTAKSKGGALLELNSQTADHIL